jgi:Tol biopolymer transport system component
VLLLALGSVASGPLVNPPGAAAQEKGFKGVAVRQVWDNGDSTGAPSPDGRYLSYVNWYTANLAVRDLETGTNRDLTDEGTWMGKSQFAYYSVWSPDGRRIAYTWANGDIFELRVVAREGGKPAVVYRNEELVWLRPHAWTQDGERILTLLRRKDRTNQIVLVSAADGSVQVVKTLDWRYPLIMSLSPDGRTIAYDLVADKEADISATRDLYLLAADGSQESVLVRHPANDYGPVWTPDGKHVVFVSDRGGTASVWMIDVRENRPQGHARLVNPSIRRMFPMGFARGGATCW